MRYVKVEFPFDKAGTYFSSTGKEITLKQPFIAIMMDAITPSRDVKVKFLKALKEFIVKEPPLPPVYTGWFLRTMSFFLGRTLVCTTAREKLPPIKIENYKDYLAKLKQMRKYRKVAYFRTTAEKFKKGQADMNIVLTRPYAYFIEMGIHPKSKQPLHFKRAGAGPHSITWKIKHSKQLFEKFYFGKR